jgi:hypothetical protein
METDEKRKEEIVDEKNKSARFWAPVIFFV